MDSLTAARASFAVSLAFHIIFAALGVGLPVLLCAAEGLGLWKRDATWYALARRWSKATGILFVVGAVSGTTISFELGLLWPRFMNIASGVIGLAFALEGFTFFLEAIFLGIYLYGWDRISPLAHWLCTLPLVFSGAAGTWMVVSANAWMNAPAGFKLVNGRATDINPIAAIFNPATPIEPLHMLVAAYQVTGFGVAAVYAFALLQGRRGAYYRRGLTLSLLLGTVMAPIQAVVGDSAAQNVAQIQPVKLAAMEALFNTTTGAPLTIMGIPDMATQQVYLAVRIPKLLSFLAYRDVNSTVQGLNAFPRSDWPSYVLMVHWAFDLMVGIGGLMILTALISWFVYFRYVRRNQPVPLRIWLLRGLAIMGPLSFVALEAGWIVTEGGRQPWVIYNIMRVEDGVTTTPGLGITLFLFIGIYLLLAVTLIALLLRLGRDKNPFLPPFQQNAPKYVAQQDSRDTTSDADSSVDSSVDSGANTTAQ
jgi:cytochrome d ubiquinol oxidase subunit I